MRFKNPYIKFSKINLFLLFLILLAIGFSLVKIIMAPAQNISSILPIISGLLFFIFGAAIFYYLFPRAGLFPLFAFHTLVGIFFILLPTFHASYWLALIAICCLIFIPPTFIHFSFLLSEILFNIKEGVSLYLFPYLLSFLILIPTLYLYFQGPGGWFPLIYFLIGYLGLAYLVWIGRLLWIRNTPHPEMERILARYLLLGQIFGFILPCLILVVLWIGGISLHWAWTSPMILLFPISLLFGLIPSQRKQLQTYLVQSEKRTAFGNVLAGLAHELNNPLNFIHSTLEPLKELHDYFKATAPDTNAKTKKALEDFDSIITNIESGVLRSEALIKQLRELPSSQQNKKEEVDLKEILEKCIGLLAHKWKDKIRIQKDLEKLPKITGRTLELEQAFTNLLSNSFDATAAGGIVQITGNKTTSGAKISIRDNGIGIPKEVITKIFDPFFTTKADEKGTGLGLAITLQIIKNHRGTVEVISEEGKGTEFLVFLPY